MLKKKFIDLTKSSSFLKKSDTEILNKKIFMAISRVSKSKSSTKFGDNAFEIQLSQDADKTTYLELWIRKPENNDIVFNVLKQLLLWYSRFNEYSKHFVVYVKPKYLIFALYNTISPEGWLRADNQNGIDFCFGNISINFEIRGISCARGVDTPNKQYETFSSSFHKFCDVNSTVLQLSEKLCKLFVSHTFFCGEFHDTKLEKAEFSLSLLDIVEIRPYPPCEYETVFKDSKSFKGWNSVKRAHKKYDFENPMGFTPWNLTLREIPWLTHQGFILVVVYVVDPQTVAPLL